MSSRKSNKVFIFALFIILILILFIAMDSNAASLRLTGGDSHIGGTFWGNILSATSAVTSATLTLGASSVQINIPHGYQSLDNHVLMYDYANLQCTLEPIGNGLSASSVASTSDVTDTNKANRSIFVYNSSTLVWEATGPEGVVASLDLIGNVTTQSKSHGQYLAWSASENTWKATTVTVTIAAVNDITDVSDTNQELGNFLVMNSDNIWEATPSPSFSVAALTDISDVSTENNSVGRVLKWNAGASIWDASDDTGSISALTDIGDVSTENNSVGRVIKWNAGASIWEASTDAGSISALTDIGDVSVGNKLVGYVIKWNAGASIWEASTTGGAGASALNDLTDVIISSPNTNEILKYNGAAWVNGTGGSGDGKAPTYIIASASAKNAANADYTCDGINDNVQIQAAIDQLNNTTGGWIYLTEGGYHIGAQIKIGTSPIKISGTGDSTILNRGFNSASAGGVIQIAAAHGSQNLGLEICDMTINGSSPTYTDTDNHGIHAAVFAHSTINFRVNIHHIFFKNIGGTAIHISNGGGSELSELIIENNLVERCTAGIYTSVVFVAPDRGVQHIIDNTIRNFNTDAITVAFGYSLVMRGNVCEWGGDEGIYITNLSGSTIEGNIVYAVGGNGYEIAVVANAGYSTLSHNVATLTGAAGFDCDMDRSTVDGNTSYGAGTDGFVFGNSFDAIISNNQSTSALDDGFYFVGCQRTLITGNVALSAGDDNFYVATNLDTSYIGNTSINSGDMGFYFNNNQQIHVVGNTVKDPAGLYGFLFFDKAIDISCVGNAVDGTGTYGIFFDRNVSDQAIRCNVLSNAITGTWTKACYIEVNSTGVNNTAFYNNEAFDLVLAASQSVLIGDNVGEVTAAGTHVLQVLPNSRTNPIATGWDVYSKVDLKVNVEALDATDEFLISTEFDNLKFIEFDWNKQEEKEITKVLKSDYQKPVSIDIEDINFSNRYKSIGSDGEVSGVQSTQLLIDTAILLQKARNEISDLKSRIESLEKK